MQPLALLSSLRSNEQHSGKDMTFKWLVLLAPALLSACLGLNPNSSPKDSFTIPVAYEVVFDRARAQAERCWSADGEFPIISTINKSDRTALVAVTGELGGSRYGQVDIRALNDQSTQVEVIVNGVNIWDVKSLAAMHEVLQFGVPTCVSYMPRPRP